MQESVFKRLTSLELVSGDDFTASNGLSFKHPLLSEIKDTSSQDVYGFMGMFTTNPEDIYVELWKYKIDFETITNFDLFLILYMNQKDANDRMFRKLTSAYFVGYAEDETTRFLIAYDEGENVIGIIDETVYNEVRWFYEKITFCKHKEKPKFASNGVKARILDMEVEDLEDKKQEEDDFGELLSALVWGNTSGYNFDNVWGLNFYQFNSGIRHIDKIKYTSALMMGYYSGNVDVKKIDRKELDWKTIT